VDLIASHRAAKINDKTASRLRLKACLFALLFCGILVLPAHLPAQAENTDQQTAQEPEIAVPQRLPQTPSPDEPQKTVPPASPLATVRGVVLNGATGEPLARALVRIEGDAEAGALTDGQGRFEIPDLPIGPQLFEVLKPGFRDIAALPRIQLNEQDVEHNVLVAGEMPELTFRLTPTGVIHGQIALSTGDTAQGLKVHLLRRAVEDGRSFWKLETDSLANGNGIFRFAGLPEGDYALYTEPTLDSEPATTLVEAGAKIEHRGYPSVFYPNARELGGASIIHLGPGEQAQADFALIEEPFYSVTATVVRPQEKNAVAADGPAEDQVLNSAGQILPYKTEVNPNSQEIQAFLPNGSYTLMEFANQRINFQTASGNSGASGMDTNANASIGSVDFAVAGHAVTGLRFAVKPPPASTALLTLHHAATHENKAYRNFEAETSILTSQSGDPATSGINTPIALNMQTGSNSVSMLFPGSYWLNTFTSTRPFCVQSLTAAGADLASEPLHVALNRAIPPLELTLRDDCAQLTLSLPPTLTAQSAGEEPAYTVYAVPEFATTTPIASVTLRPSSGGSAMLEGLTPGAYRIYTFDHPVEVAFREARAALPDAGQSITLAPEDDAHLVVEVPR
jgi:hypothetical protein